MDGSVTRVPSRATFPSALLCVALCERENLYLRTKLHESYQATRIIPYPSLCNHARLSVQQKQKVTYRLYSRPVHSELCRCRSGITRATVVFTAALQRTGTTRKLAVARACTRGEDRYWTCGIYRSVQYHQARRQHSFHSSTGRRRSNQFNFVLTRINTRVYTCFLPYVVDSTNAR